jgi:NADPH:quinone reductase-like Zn-dependent oxidoreductase
MATANTGACTEKKQNLVTLTQLIEDGKITPAIDRCYPFEQIPAAISYQEQGQARGKVVITS